MEQRCTVTQARVTENVRKYPSREPKTAADRHQQAVLNLLRQNTFVSADQKTITGSTRKAILGL
jgi:hypothetical protein